MKPLTLNPNSQPVPETSKLSIDMAEQIADRAARKAAEETSLRNQEQSRGNMDNFNRGQGQNNQQNKQPPVERDSIYEEPEGGYSIDTKTEKNLMRRLLDQTLQKALDPPAPSPIENAVTTVMNTVSAGIAEKMLGNIGGAAVVNKSSFILDVLNSQFGAGLGQTLGNNLPQLVQSLSGAIGQQKAQELASAATRAMNQQPEQQTPQNNDNSNAEKQKDMVLALDSNNPEHIKQYASAMGLTEKAAKGMLQIHQDDIINERKIFGGSGSNTNNSELSQALIILTQEMSGIKSVIGNLQNELFIMKGGNPNIVSTTSAGIEVDTDSRWNDNASQRVSVENRSVNLFKSPIKVDLDEIKGDSDPFFTEKSKSNINLNKITAKPVSEISEEPTESVLEESKDDAGNSTFKMSNDKEQSKIVTEKIVKKVEEKEEDKKKESDHPNLIELDVKNKTDKKNEYIKKDENNDETQKIEHKIVRKKIDKNNVLVEKSSSKIERYDINNNLILEEDKIL